MGENHEVPEELAPSDFSGVEGAAAPTSPTDSIGGAACASSLPASAVTSKSTKTRNIHGGKILLRDGIHIEVQHKFMRAGVKVLERLLRGNRRAQALHIGRQVPPHGRALQEFQLGRVELLNAKQCYVGLAHKRGLSPEAHQLRGAASDNVRHSHSVQAP